MQFGCDGKSGSGSVCPKTRVFSIAKGWIEERANFEKSFPGGLDKVFFEYSKPVQRFESDILQ